MGSKNKVLETVSDNFRRWRQPLSQESISRTSGVSQKTISNIENAKNFGVANFLGLQKAIPVPSFTYFISGTFTPEEAKQLGNLVQHFLACGEEGQSQILKVAEAEARFASLPKMTS